MFENIEAKNYRGLKNFKLDNIKQFNLIFGKNSSFKTSILETLFFLSAPTNVDLLVKLNHSRGGAITNIKDNSWDLIFHKLDSKNQIELFGNLQKKLSETRKIEIIPQLDTDDRSNNKNKVFSTNGYIVNSEFILKNEEEPKKVKMTLKNNNGKLQKIASASDISSTIKCSFLTSKNYFTENIVRRLHKVLINKKKEPILNVLKKIDPSVKDIVIGMNGLIFLDVGLKNMIPLSTLGDSIEKMLSILLTVIDSDNGIVLIDNIDTLFERSFLDFLLKECMTIANDKYIQFFATTSSVETVRTFSSAYSKSFPGSDNMNVIKLERKDYDTKVINYDNKKMRLSIDNEWKVR